MTSMNRTNTLKGDHSIFGRSKFQKVLLLSMSIWLLSTPLPAQHFIEKGTVKVSLKVTMRGVDIPLDSLCDGFDPETNNPINLVIPEQSTIWMAPDTSMNATSYLLKTREPRYIHEPVTINHSGYSSSTSPGSEITYAFVDDISSDTVRISWQVAYAKVELIDLYPAAYFPDFVSFQFQNQFEEYPAISQFDWSKKSYVTEVDARGVPVRPRFPYAENDLLFVVGKVSEDAVVQLKGFHNAPQTLDRENPFEHFLYEDLPEGDYEFIVRPFAEAPESKTLRYAFTILRPWWFGETAMVGYTFFLTVFGGGLFFLFYRRREHNRAQELLWKQKLSEAELKAIRAQLNPHFLFNALSSIQNLVTQQKNEVANTYLTKLSRLLRQVLAASEHTFHELSSELELTRLYLELEKLRYTFDYRIMIGKEVSQEVLTPVMLLQPYVENAVKHGMAGRKEGFIEVEVHVAKNKLMIEVKDDGPGLSQPGQHSSGLQLSQKRIRPLNELYGNEATIEIRDRQQQKGVSVLITLPIG